jgi:hypothetical protein
MTAKILAIRLDFADRINKSLVFCRHYRRAGVPIGRME